MSDWQKGYPDTRGLYRCKVDGQEKILVHHVCVINDRHWWSDIKGYDVVGCEILFQNKKLSADDLK